MKRKICIFIFAISFAIYFCMPSYADDTSVEIDWEGIKNIIKEAGGNQIIYEETDDEPVNGEQVTPSIDGKAEDNTNKETPAKGEQNTADPNGEDSKEIVDGPSSEIVDNPSVVNPIPETTTNPSNGNSNTQNENSPVIMPKYGDGLTSNSEQVDISSVRNSVVNNEQNNETNQSVVKNTDKIDKTQAENEEKLRNLLGKAKDKGKDENVVIVEDVPTIFNAKIDYDVRVISPQTFIIIITILAAVLSAVKVAKNSKKA